MDQPDRLRKLLISHQAEERVTPVSVSGMIKEIKILGDFGNLRMRFGDADQFRLSRRTLRLATTPPRRVGRKAT